MSGTRTHGRFTPNVMAAGLAVVILGAAASACANGTGPGGPASAPGASPASPHAHANSSPSAAATQACTGGQLRAVGSMQGAAGSREGAITLTNFSSTTCTLQGTPSITLLDQNLKPITSGVTFTTTPAGWQVDASPAPAGWPVVTIHPGAAASFRIRWSNWCPQGRVAPLWKVGIPASGSVDVINGMDEPGPPPCNGQGQPSTIEVGPFEPAT